MSTTEEASAVYTNGDDLIEYLEIAHTGVFSVTAVLDGDGTANVWDDDNDSDGVPDGLDPSPFSKTSTSASVHLDVTTTGQPTYVDFQLRPDNPNHLGLPDGAWDWREDYDGQMQDADLSQEDVRIMPMLEIDASQYPMQYEVSEYGMGLVNAFDPSAWSGIRRVDGIGSLTAGGGAALADIDYNGTPDLLLMGIDDPDGTNDFRYKIGWNLDASGNPTQWTGSIDVLGIGSLTAGGGVALADFNDKGALDLLVMDIDDPSGTNNFRYRIAWDLNHETGIRTTWSETIEVDGIGSLTAGGGVALADIDGNGDLDLVLMGIDNPGGDDEFRYKVGWNLSTSGVAASWTDTIEVPGIGDATDGGGAAVADINGNGRPDLVLMGVDDPSGANAFRYKVGWDLDSSGQPLSWSTHVEQQDLEYNNDGGANDFLYKVGWDLENKLYIPLSQVRDDETTVALSGRMYLPPSDPGTLSLNAELVWMVRAETERFG